MDIGELTIGNYVYYNEFGNRTIHKVLEITGDKVKLSDTKLPYTPFRYIEPIPITNGLLSTMGFKPFYAYMQMAVGKHWIACDDKHISVLYEDRIKLDIDIFYLHELQNSFKMLKIRKEIVL